MGTDTIAELIASFGAIAGLDGPFKSAPAARVAILEGKVKLNGSRICPGSHYNAAIGKHIHNADYPIPRGSCRIEVWDSTKRCWIKVIL